jgi:L-ascorbate metabolism protein UlaG (beta-lactamase superfamily)
METVAFSDAKIMGIPFTGEHSDMNILSKLCYIITIGDFKLMFMADSRVTEPKLYSHIQKLTGDIDVMFLGMECDGAPLSWLYGPLLTTKLPRDQDQTRRLNGSDCQRGISLVEIFNPKEAYVYAMGQEPWIEFITSTKYTSESNPIIQSDLFVQKCLEMGLIAERLFGEKELLFRKVSETNI